QQASVPNVPIDASDKGGYAYWISDEGVKARIDLQNPYRTAESDEQRRLAVSTSQSNSISYASDDLKAAWPEDDQSFDRLVSLGQAELLGSGLDNLQNRYFHDLSAHSQGLLTDVKKGGLKRDLTLAFENENVFERWFGRRQASETTPAASITG